MKAIEITAKQREDLGKKSTKKLRRENNVPCVIYGGEKQIHFYASQKEFKSLIYTPNVYLVKLNIDDKSYSAIMQDLQFHPVTDKLLHIDFFEYNENSPVTIYIPIVPTGIAAGVKEGGILNIIKRKLKIKALAKDLPDTLNVNVEEIKLGQAKKVKELKFDNCEILDPANGVVVTVKLTRAARGLDAEEETTEEETTEAETETKE